MMNLRGFLMCFVAHSIAIQPAKAELPGLSSDAICSSNQSDIVKPWFCCKDQLKLGNKKNDIDPWCRKASTEDIYREMKMIMSFERFSQCVETSLKENSTLSACDRTNLQENSTLSEGFLNQVFDKKLMDKRIKYLCSDRDFYGVEQCLEEVSSCQQAFRQQLSEQQCDNRKACSIAETLVYCIWTNRRCPAKLKYLLARLSDSYTISKCTKYLKETVGDKCVKLRRELYPDISHMDTCLKGVMVLVGCLSREMMDSEHTADMFYSIDASRTNVYVYETFRCENIQLHGNKSCFDEFSNMDMHCLDVHLQEENNFHADIMNDEHIPVEKICSFYNRTAECFQTAHPNCHPRSNELVAMLCTLYPKSCQCPLGLTKEYADRLHKDKISDCSLREIQTLHTLFSNACSTLAAWKCSIMEQRVDITFSYTPNLTSKGSKSSRVHVVGEERSFEPKATDDLFESITVDNSSQKPPAAS